MVVLAKKYLDPVEGLYPSYRRDASDPLDERFICFDNSDRCGRPNRIGQHLAI